MILSVATVAYDKISAMNIKIVNLKVAIIHIMITQHIFIELHSLYPVVLYNLFYRLWEIINNIFMHLHIYYYQEILRIAIRAYISR